MTPRITARSALAISAAWAAVALLLLTHSMYATFDHDENQFIASAALMARHGLLPYRDYPYFHMPYLVPVYALIFHFTDHLLMGARLFCAACGLATLATIAFTAARLLAHLGPFLSRLITALFVIILLGNPVFLDTGGRSWNHDIPTLMCLLAFLLACRPGAASAAGAGALMGLAIGVRLTFAPAALVFPAAILWLDRSVAPPLRRRRAAAYLLGMAVALAPCLCFFVPAPRQFIFGNLQYPHYNTLFHSLGQSSAAILSKKLRYPIENVLNRPGNLGLAIFVVATLVAFHRLAHPDPHRRFQIRLLILLIAALILGGFAPTPLFWQYFFTPTVFALVAAVYALSALDLTAWRLRAWLAVMSAVAIIAVGDLWLTATIRNSAGLFSPHTWVTITLHDEGRLIASHAAGRPVLTLSPALPLEGGADIYPALATGPFAWRVAPLVPEPLKSTQDLWDADNLEQHLQKNPPGLIMFVVAADGPLADALVDYAQRHRLPVIAVEESVIRHRRPSPLPW